MSKPILYFDMDGVLVDFVSAFEHYDLATVEKYGKKAEIDGMFALMKPLDGAIDAVHTLAPHFDVYALSTAPWNNPSAWIDKILWIKKYFGDSPDSVFYKRLILSHYKNLNAGDFLIDDRLKNGASGFKGEHIHFMTDPKFMNWQSVTDYLLNTLVSKDTHV